MKKYTVCIFLFFSLISFSQEKETEKNDSTRLVIGNKVYTIFHKKGAIDRIDVDVKDTTTKKKSDLPEVKAPVYSKYGHWGGMDFGSTVLLNSQGKEEFTSQSFLENDPAKSFYISLNLLEHKFPIVNNYVGFTTGIGFDWKKIGLKNNQLLNVNADSVWVTTDPKYVYTKNFLRVTYLTLPLFLEFNTRKDPSKSWFFLVGVVGGMRLGSKFIQKMEDKSHHIENKFVGDYALNPFKFDASVRLGYKNMGLFTSYALIPIFDQKHLEQAYPFTFGISWIW
jgi:hypothetical protein